MASSKIRLSSIKNTLLPYRDLFSRSLRLGLSSAKNRSVIAINKLVQFCFSGITACPFIKQFTEVFLRTVLDVQIHKQLHTFMLLCRVKAAVYCGIDDSLFSTSFISLGRSIFIAYGLSSNFKYN